MINQIIPLTHAEQALASLMDWAVANFDQSVADGVNALALTGLQALSDRTLAADYFMNRAAEAEAYAHELERQRDYLSEQLMIAEASGRITGQRETVREISRTLRVTPADAINLLKTLTGETQHLLGYAQTEQAADLARAITADIRRESQPLTANLPALPDDFDLDSEREEF